MATPNPQQKNSLNPTINLDSFAMQGHPGRWNRVIEVQNTSTSSFTGSDYGAGAIILTNTACTIHFTDGGSIPGTALAVNELYEFSISKVVNNASAKQYVFIRNGVVR